MVCRKVLKVGEKRRNSSLFFVGCRITVEPLSVASLPRQRTENGRLSTQFNQVPPESLPSSQLTLHAPDRNTVTSFESPFWETAAKAHLTDKPPVEFPVPGRIWDHFLPHCFHPHTLRLRHPQSLPTHTPSRQAQLSMRNHRHKAGTHSFCATSRKDTCLNTLTFFVLFFIEV